MSKFCTSCGASLSDEAGFCTNCGAKSPQTAPAQPAFQTAPAMNQNTPISNITAALGTPVDFIKARLKNMNKNVCVGICAVVAGVLVIILLLSILGGAYKKPIRNMVKGMDQQDFDKYLSAFADDEQDSIKDSVDDEDDYMKDQMDIYEDIVGNDVDISYDILDKTKLDKDQLDDYEDSYKSRYDEKTDITKGYDVCVKVTIKGDDEKRVNYRDVTVLKIDGKWCVYSGGL
ncbi:MAG: zinc ribbon domain-containing protein [Oscillospiraceae bacterium]